MRRFFLTFALTAVVLAVVAPGELWAQRRRRVVVRTRHPRAKLVVRRGFPIRRTLPRTVVVRPARTAVVVGAPLVFLPAVVWAATTTSRPPRERLVWEDSEVLTRDEEWVECNFGVDNRGDALLLDVQGAVQLNFAEVTFASGQVQVIDFEDRPRGNGTYRLLDFSDGRHVKTVRVLAQATSPEARLTLYMSK